jgi:hypothetical protein
MIKFGSKIAAFALISTATIALSACGSLPTCNDELDKCDRNGAYTEERTVEAGRKAPAPAPMPEPTPAPAPVAVPAPAPEPMPEPVMDKEVMQSAEPQFTHISK